MEETWGSGQIEHLVSLAKFGVTGLSPIEQSKKLAALLESWDADAGCRLQPLSSFPGKCCTMNGNTLFLPGSAGGFQHGAFSGSGQADDAGESFRSKNVMQCRALFIAQPPAEAFSHGGILFADSMGDMGGTDRRSLCLGQALCASPKLVFRSQIVFGGDVIAFAESDQIGRCHGRI